MYSTFIISKANCLSCSNQTLKGLGSLQGVFGADINQIEGKIVVSHTDEISREDISKMLFELGYVELENKQDILSEINYDEPSIWGCAL